ncbi:MAG: glycosyltransferase [Deltaproteobacteria bacterium]|jgi:glycosyltransferase involved in cell wall biosynthesis/SAM-dependent methyltransferase|nr:glycosyltransferase [Deltaproteobacteria bacterium]
MSLQKDRPRLLNLGCGNAFHSDWVNLDVSSSNPAVLAYDLHLGIPFADDSFDVVYHSHVLEHLERPYAEHLLRECFRALKPGGTLRVAVPNLEAAVRAYLAALDEARSGDANTQKRHEWMIIELLDQLTRTESGGEMLRWWAENPMPQEKFIAARMGGEMSRAVEQLRRNPPAPKRPRAPLPTPDPAFASSGELHRWMYDEISLAGLLRNAGFTDITRQSHNSSRLPDILRYKLDVLDDGGPRKPDSLFMEAVKPERGKNSSVRVALLCGYDHGGAGTAALRLHKALRDLATEGVISQFYCASQKTSTQGVHLAPVPGQSARNETSGVASLTGLEQCRRELAEKLTAYPTRPAGREFFSMPLLCCDPAKIPLFEDFDLVNLHWTACMYDPALAPEALQGRPVVWTLHDMAPFTGGCHYSAGCTRFGEQCGQCPELGSDDPKDLSFETWRTRMGIYRALNLHIVCPSAWLAGEAKKSSLLGRFPVRVIPYSQPLDLFRPLDRATLRASLGLLPEDFVLLFVSQGLNNERKGGAYLLEALRRLAGLPHAARTRLILLGNNPPADFFQTGLRAEAAGHVDDPQHMAILYNAADAVLVPSLEDNSPNVVCEALGCGTPAVAFAAGGIPEMVLHEETGRLAPVGDVAGLLSGIEWAASVKDDAKLRLRCRAFALEKWNAPARARDYLNLFRELGERHP